MERRVESTGFVPTISSMLRRKHVVHENVVFKKAIKIDKSSHSVKNISPQEEYENNCNKFSNSNASFSLKKLRYEVIKLGTSGMKPTKKKQLSIATAVSLGAKAPKNEYKNYKKVKAEKSKLDNKDETISLKKHGQKHLYVVGNKIIFKGTGDKKFLKSYGKVRKSDRVENSRKRR